MIASQAESLPPNRWPLNRDAKKRLQEAKATPDAGSLYLVQLLQLGFEKGLQIPGPAQSYWHDLEGAANQLTAPNLQPTQVMRWLLSNPNAGEQSEQNDSLRRELETATTWQEAAQNLMQWFYALKASQDPYYRPAPHVQ